MRRAPTEYPNYKIMKVNPLFWKRCLKCGHEVKREPMYAVRLLWNKWGYLFYESTVGIPLKYFCTECFDYESLKKYCDDMTGG